MRRILTILLLLTIIAAAGWMLYSWERRTAGTSDPWSAIPPQSAIILSVPDAWSTWDRFTHTSQLWGAFEQIPAFAAAGRLMGNTVERMQNDASLREALEHAPLLMCLMHGGGEEAGALFIGQPNGEAATPMTAFSELMKLDNAAISSLSKGEVVQVRPDTALPALSICMRDRIWLIATSVQVMDEALLQLNSGGSILQDSSLVQARRTVGGGADAHAFVDLRRAARLLDIWVDRRISEEIVVPAGWAALDIRSRPDAILMSGLLTPARGDHQLQALREQGTGTTDVKRVLPASVSALELQHISDPVQALTHRRGEDQEELAPALFHWVQGSMGRAWAENGEGDPLRWAFFQANDPDDARVAIMSLCAPEKPCEQLEYRGNVLQRIEMLNALPRLLGPDYDRYERPWWTTLGQIVLFSPTPEALRASIDAWNDGNSLAMEPRSTAWDQRISNASARLFWMDLARSNSLIRSALKPSVQTDGDGLAGFLEQVGGISVQISPGQRGFYHIVAGMQHAPVQQQSDRVLWETEVAAPVARRPMLVRNHNNNTNEVLVQDEENGLHLIGSTGKVLWSRKLDGPIMGQVHQVDRYRNGKLQILFNTEGRLHLIDRNGQDVGGFPVKFPERAAIPISVFDYENERDYRVLVATAEGRILNYGLDGTQVTGWEKPVHGATAAFPVQHLRIKNKDYLIFADVKGQMHILDRRGTVREQTALNLGPNPRLDRIVPGMDIMTSSIIWSDTAGTLQQGSFDGPVQRLSAEGATGTSCTLDIDGDGVYELVRIHADSLDISREGRPIFLRTYGSSLDTELFVHSIGQRRKALGMANTEAGHVSLLDDTGRDLPGLPLPGICSPLVADLNLDDVPELITVTPSGKVVAYSLHGL